MSTADSSNSTAVPSNSTAVSSKSTADPSTDKTLKHRTKHSLDNAPRSAAAALKEWLSTRFGSLVAILIAITWTVPTFGLFLTSFRPETEIKTSGWWEFFKAPSFVLDNYQEVLVGASSSGSLLKYFINSLVITIPATLAPLLLAAMAAYAFSVMKWFGRDTVFVVVFALQIIPLQMALIPLLRMFSGTSFIKTFPFASIWVAHTIFALPLAIFLLHNFMTDIPHDLVEAAKVDGAGHVKVFLKIILPLMVPAFASLAIFQFLWVWNDLLVGLTFSGGNAVTEPLTARLASMAGSRGQAWHLLTAGAFVSIFVPLVVFLSLQRFFIRGLLSGSVKG